MSKSVGNVVDPIALVSEFGVSIRCVLPLREIAFGQDGSLAKRASPPASTPTWPTRLATWRSARRRWSPRTSMG